MQNKIWINRIVAGIILVLISTYYIPIVEATGNTTVLNLDKTLLKIERIYASTGVINVELKNIGTVDAIDVFWILGYGQIRFLPPALTFIDTDGHISQLAANESVTLKTNQGSNPTALLFGFSPLVIKFIAYAYNAPLVSNTTNGFLLFIFIKI